FSVQSGRPGTFVVDFGTVKYKAKTRLIDSLRKSGMESTSCVLSVNPGYPTIELFPERATVRGRAAALTWHDVSDGKILTILGRRPNADIPKRDCEKQLGISVPRA